ncbi:MAG: branched-chain amino acid ABC transporter permease [Clostridia bacterium]|nr:branched-chain amino acid ABC transporter permease [Clostridia bacterium]
MGYFLDTLIDSSMPMCVTALVTMAITLIFKTSFTTNFAQGVISAFGAYVASTLFAKMGMPVFVAVPISVIASMTIAVLVDVVLFRKGRYVNAIGKQIITMGLISVIVSVIPLIFTDLSYQAINFISGNFTFYVGDYNVTFSKNALVGIIITVIVLVLLFVLLRYSKWGLSVRATASNEYVAGMMGVNTHVVTAVSWGIAGALGALAACLNSAGNAEIGVYFMTEYQVTAFLAGIVGGFATFHGPVIIALCIPLMTNLISWFGNGVISSITGDMQLGASIANWSTTIIYVIALIIIFFKPNGLFGKKVEKKV